jgi:ribonuclease P protein component
MSAGDQSFPESARLTKRSQYLSLQRDGQRLVSPHFVFLWKQNRLSYSRLGITVTKRITSAVGRNRLKRLVREAYRLTSTSMNAISNGVDLVVIAKRGAPTLRYSQVSQELRKALNQIHQALND